MIFSESSKAGKSLAALAGPDQMPSPRANLGRTDEAEVSDTLAHSFDHSQQGQKTTAQTGVASPLSSAFDLNWRIVIGVKVRLIKGMKASSVVKVDPEIMSGTPCFAGTRVPARTLIDYLESGDPLDDFLEDFPTVSREQAVALLEEASELLIPHA